MLLEKSSVLDFTHDETVRFFLPLYSQGSIILISFSLIKVWAKGVFVVFVMETTKRILVKCDVLQSDRTLHLLLHPSVLLLYLGQFHWL